MLPQTLNFSNVVLAAGNNIGQSIPVPAGAMSLRASAVLSARDVADPLLSLTGMVETSADGINWTSAGGGWRGGQLDALHGNVPAQPGLTIGGDLGQFARWSFLGVSRQTDPASGSLEFS